MVVNLLPSAYRHHADPAHKVHRAMYAWLRCPARKLHVETMGNCSSDPILAVFLAPHHNPLRMLFIRSHFEP